MSESGEENENVNGQNEEADDDDEFSFYLQFTKPLVLELTEPEDRAIAAAWVRKLEAGSDEPEEKQLRINYLKLLLFVLQRGRLGGIFRKQPPSGSLQRFPAGFNIFDMGNLILDQDDLQPAGAGDGRTVNYNIEISNDLREFVASQEIPNFGIQMYYAWSSDEPINKWSMFDEDKFPRYVLDKIKLLKETQSEEKSGSVRGSQTKKKICELPIIEKCPKKKVKSPQEIERSQGRSFHTYMGLVGRMGNFEKCDGDPERYQRLQPQQARGNCPRRISQNQNQCPGQGQRRFTNQECEDEQGEDNFQNFAPGLSDMVNAQSRPCLCPYPCHHDDCPEHRGAKGGSHLEPVARISAANTSMKQICGPSEWGTSGSQTVTKGPGMARCNEFDASHARTSIGIPQGSHEAQCPQRRSSSSPSSRTNCPSHANLEPPPQDFCGRQHFNQGSGGSNNFCTCPCPRQHHSMVGPSASATGIMGGMGGMTGMSCVGNIGGMAGMGGMGGMPVMGSVGCMGVMAGAPGMGGMGGMPGMGGMGGMHGMGGMGGMQGMGGMGGMQGMGGMGGMHGMGGMGGMQSMGGMGCTANMGRMASMSGMAGMGGMGGTGAGRTYPSGRLYAQEKSRPNIRGNSDDCSQPMANYRTPQIGYCPRADGPPPQGAMPSGNRSNVNNAKSRQNVLHCYDSQQVDPGLTRTIQKNATAMECSGTNAPPFNMGEENAMHSQTCLKDISPDERTKQNERNALICAARENRASLAAKKTLFDAGTSKSQSSQLPCPNAATVVKRQQSSGVCPTVEVRSPDYSSCGSEKVMSNERSSSMEPLSQSPSPRPQAACPTSQQTYLCPPKPSKAPGSSFQGQDNYGQDRQACPTAGTRTLSPNRHGPAKTMNLSKQYQNASKGGGGTFAVNNESGRLCNMAGLLQGMRQMTENYRAGAHERSAAPAPCHLDQRESAPDVDFECTTYLEPPPPRPDVYYSPQPRKKNIVVSPCPERDVASLPDRMTGMGIFNPQKMPTQAQPLPNTPPDCAYIDYNRYEGDEESFLYGTEESSYDQPRNQPCPPEEPIVPSPMKAQCPQGRERSQMSDRTRDCSKRRDHSADAHQCPQESKPHPSPRRQETPHKFCRRDNFVCSTPNRSHTTLPMESAIHPSSMQDTYPDIVLTNCDDQSRGEFVQLFSGSRRDDTNRCPPQMRDSVHFETLQDYQSHQDSC